MQLEAQWIVGFVDGEGCFYVGINPHAEMSIGHQILPEFTVVQHERDVAILYALKAYFGCGVVRTNHGDRMAYRVRSKDHLLQKSISEIPCRVSSDLHEWRNDFPAVSNIGSVKLNSP